MCPLFFFLLLCADVFDFMINPTTIPRLENIPVEIKVQLLDDQNAREVDVKTLTLKLTETPNDRRPNEFFLSDVDIKIRNINSTYFFTVVVVA